MKLVFDIESNGLDYKAPDFKVHCVCILDYYTGDEWRFSSADPINTIEKAVWYLNNARLIIGHNIQSYDIPALEYYTKKTITAKPFDTLVMSRLMFPLQDGQSLGDWGERLGISKTTEFDYTDFSTLTPEMIAQCLQDVRITRKLYDHLCDQNWSQESIDLETEIATIIQKQVDRGICFDVDNAEQLYATLCGKRSQFKHELQIIFNPYLSEAYRILEDKRFKEFNPASRDHIAHCLNKKYGWQPNKRTPTGKPCVDAEVLSLLDYPEAKLLVEYFQVNKIIGMLSEGDRGWLKLVKSNRIHGQVFTTGTITGRMSHGKPNLAQVPRVSSYLGKECRSLFVASPGKVLVGVDASGLEARCAAHYLYPYDDGALVDRVLSGDVHRENAKLLFDKDDISSAERTIAKTSFFAFIYGAQAPKIGKICDISLDAAEKLKKQLDRRFPMIKKFRYIVEDKAKKGFLWGLDGRKIFIRTNAWGRPDSPVNYLFQSAGAILMKKALQIAHSKNPELEFVLNVHDEIQTECFKSDAEAVGKLLVQSIQEAGIHYQFLCPLDGEIKIGANWSQTH